MTYSVEVINQRDLRKKLARPQSQLHLTDDLLFVCTENEERTQGYIYALEHNKPDMPDRWPWPYCLPENYVARFAVHSPKHNLLIVSASNWRTTLSENSFLLAIDITTGQAVWRFPEHNDLINLSAPTLVQDNVFIVTKERILLLSLENPNHLIWSEPFPFNPHWFYNGITTDESMIYVSIKNDGVACINQKTGKLECRYIVPEGEVWLAAAINKQRIIVGTSIGQLIAFDKNAPNQKSLVQVGRETTTGPLIHSTDVFVGTKAFPSTNGKFTYQIIAARLFDDQLDPSTFQLLTLDSKSHFYAPLMLSPDGLILCGSNNGYLYALDPNNGKEHWRHYMQNELRCSPVFSQKDIVIVVDHKGNINKLKICEQLHGVMLEQVPTQAIEDMLYPSISLQHLPEEAFANKSEYLSKQSLSENIKHQGIPEIDRKKLLNFLREHFDVEELRDLCFQLHIRHQDVKGSTVGEFSRELIEYCERRGNLPNLIITAYEMRPNISY